MSGGDAIQGALGDINPQLPYYLMLFVLTVILRFVRTYRSRPRDPNVGREERADYWARYTYFGFEFVNVAAGVFILLSEHATQYIATVTIGYVVLVVLSFFFEEEGAHRMLRTIGHLFVSAIVIIVTIYSFTSVEGLMPAKEAPQPVVQQQATEKWRVALPYIDSALNRNFGVREAPIQSVYIVEVAAASRSEALQAAKQSFFSASGPQPFLPRTEKTSLTMFVLEGEAVVEPIPSA